MSILKPKPKYYSNQSQQAPKTKMNESEIEANMRIQRHWWQNACQQVTIGWLSESGKRFFNPIKEQSKAKPKQTQHYFRHSFTKCSIHKYSQFIHKYSQFIHTVWPVHTVNSMASCSSSCSAFAMYRKGYLFESC